MKHLNFFIRKACYIHQSKKLNQLSEAELGPYLIYYAVKFIKQEHGNMCRDACEAMLHYFFGTSFYSMASNPRSPFIPKENFDREFTMVENSVNSILELKNLLMDKGPLILPLPMVGTFGHNILCVGTTQHDLIYHDPLEGTNRCLPFEVYKALLDDSTLPKAIAYHQSADEPQEKENLETRLYRGFFPALKENDLSIKPSHAAFFAAPTNGKAYRPIECAIDFLKDYTSGKSMFHPKRKFQQEVKNILNEFESYRTCMGNLFTAKYFTVFLDDHLPFNLGSDPLAGRITTIKTYLGH